MGENSWRSAPALRSLGPLRWARKASIAASFLPPLVAFFFFEKSHRLTLPQSFLTCNLLKFLQKFHKITSLFFLSSFVGVKPKTLFLLGLPRSKNHTPPLSPPKSRRLNSLFSLRLFWTCSSLYYNLGDIIHTYCFFSGNFPFSFPKGGGFFSSLTLP